MAGLLCYNDLNWRISVLLALFSSLAIQNVRGDGMHNIHWNSTNSFFRNKENSNVIKVNGGNHPWEYDQVNIVCPVYKPGSSTARKMEQYIIYSVSKQEYDTCRITQPNPRIIAVCNRPHELMYFTITFRSFTPTPGGLEFRPGQDYYFISTSSRTDLHRRVGGACSTNNMKITFKVAEDKAANPSASLRPSLDLSKVKQVVKQEQSRQNFSFTKKTSSNSFGGSRPPTSTAGTLYYPMREMAKLRELERQFVHKRKEFYSKMQGDDPSATTITTRASAFSSATSLVNSLPILVLSCIFVGLNKLR